MPSRSMVAQNFFPESSSPDFVESIEFGVTGSSSYRAVFVDVNKKNLISPWHDIELYGPGGHLACVCSTPAGEWVRYEPANSEPFNPIRIKKAAAGMKGGKPSSACAKAGGKAGKKRVQLAHFADNAPWNHGFLSQTWAAANDVAGPLEVVEIGAERMRQTGEVYYVKPLGAFPVDEGEASLSWKILAIAADDPMAPLLWDWLDMNKQLPGILGLIRDWLRTCLCVQAGDKESVIHFQKPAKLSQTLAKITEHHQLWQLYQAKRQESVLPPSISLSPQSLEATWQQYMPPKYVGLPLLTLPLTCPDLDSAVLFDVEWLNERKREEPAAILVHKSHPAKESSDMSTWRSPSQRRSARCHTTASVPGAEVAACSNGSALTKMPSFHKPKRGILQILHLSPGPSPSPSPNSSPSSTSSISPTSPFRNGRKSVSRFWSFTSSGAPCVEEGDYSTPSSSPPVPLPPRRSHEIIRPKLVSPVGGRHRSSLSSEHLHVLSSNELVEPSQVTDNGYPRFADLHKGALIDSPKSNEENEKASSRRSVMGASRLLKSVVGRGSGARRQEEARRCVSLEQGTGGAIRGMPLGEPSHPGCSSVSPVGAGRMGTASVSVATATAVQGARPSSRLPMQAGTRQAYNLTPGNATATALCKAGGSRLAETAALTAARVACKEEEKTERRRSKRRTQSLTVLSAPFGKGDAMSVDAFRQEIVARKGIRVGPIGEGKVGTSESDDDEDEDDERWGGGEGGLKRRGLPLRRSRSFHERSLSCALDEDSD